MRARASDRRSTRWPRHRRSGIASSGGRRDVGSESGADAAVAVRLHIDLAGRYTQRGRLSEALRELDIAISLDPLAHVAHVLRGQLLDASSRTSEAGDAFRTAGWGTRATRSLHTACCATQRRSISTTVQAHATPCCGVSRAQRCGRAGSPRRSRRSIRFSREAATFRGSRRSSTDRATRGCAR